MFKKKHMFILLLLMVGLLTISSASANENVTDIITNDDVGVNDVSAKDVSADDVATGIEEEPTINVADEIETQETQTSENNDDKLSMDESEEVLEIPYHDEYRVWVADSTIHRWQDESIIIHVDPSDDYLAYDFYIKVYDSKNEPIFSKELYSETPYTSIKYYFSANQFAVGTYTIKLINYADGELMDTAKLTVINDPFYAVFSAGNYNAYYNSGAKYTIKVTEKGTGSALNGVSVKVVFSNSKKTVTKYYKSSNGYIKFVPPVGVGTYRITISSNNAHVIATALKKTATVKKSSVTMKAYKAKTYKGFKLTLKATVKSRGKNVNEGKVTFKINGKTYTAAVKNGVATKKIKLKKIKSYKYTATFKGDNFYSKKVKGKAVVKKRYATKITVKNQKGYMGNKKTITVKVTTKNGKKVKDGYIDVGGTGTYSIVKKGKAKLYVSFTGNYQGYSGLTLYYKKSVSSKYKLKYIPSSLKYKSSKKKIKITSKFRCDICGKKSSHSHYINGYKINIHVY